MNTTLLKTAVLTFFITALASFGDFAPEAYAANPCNPCGGGMSNPCGGGMMNPCGGGMMNPCGGGMSNPCGGKRMSNPCGGRANACNPCNPCASKPVVPLRSLQQPCVNSLVKQGKKTWNNEKLGKSGFSCMTCHDDHELLSNKPWPHYIEMAKDVFTLDQMINFCMLNPMDGKKIDPNSLQMTSMGAFYNEYMKTWKPTVPKKGKGNPCNPCGGSRNPCNPCGR